MVGIITYPFISGLYYLAKSFAGYLESIGEDYVLIPKKSFVLDGQRWTGIFKYELDGFEKLNSNISYQIQLLSLCKTKNIKTIVSFETFMRDSSWVDMLSKYGIKIVDIPMPEWSLKSDIISGRYRKFDSVYCLTNQTYDLFSRYSKAERKKWDFCPDISVVEKQKSETLTFYHPGSAAVVNQKNTISVIQSLKLIPYKNINFLFSGFLGAELNDSRCVYLGQKINRHEIISAYHKADCIISPSTREGLGMCLYEAKKVGCDIITTDAAPMNEHSKYLCRVSGYNQSESIIPFASVEPSAIAEQIVKYYEDFYEPSKNIRTN